MMKRYHLSPKTGNPGVCSATVSCPFGDINNEHYESAEEARSVYEAKQSSFPDMNALPTRTSEGKEIKALSPRQSADVEAMNKHEFRLYRRERYRWGKSHVQAFKAVEDGRSEFHDQFQNSSEASKKAKQILAGEPAVAPLAVPHAHPEDKATKAGTTYSAVTPQPDESSAMTVNGKTVLVFKSKNGMHPVKLDGATIGSFGKRKDGKWSVDYGASSGRPAPTAADAAAALLKKAGQGPEKPKVDVPPAPKRGHNPDESEIDRYSLRSNKDRTVGNLRKLSTRDLVAEYNTVTINQNSSSYSNEHASDDAALKRIAGVLGERGERLEISRYSEPRPGYDFGGPEQFKLASKETV